MSEDGSIHLLDRWREGEQAAATELFQRYAERLIVLAHRRLSERLAIRIQAEDVVQSVFFSFFVGARDGRYVLERSGDFWRLLVAITIHKVQRQYRWHHADKRDLQREERQEFDDDLTVLPTPILSRDPSPEEAAMLADTVEQVMRGLEPMQRRIMELRLQGCGVGDIAEQTSRSRATVRRVLDRAKALLARQHLPTAVPDPESPDDH